jgi:hypothetical protein
MAKRIRDFSEAELDALAEEMAVNVERMRAAPELAVIQAMVEAGCPRKDAVAQMATEQLEGFARQFYLDTLDARLGNPEAKERVERCREVWGRMTQRREEQR